jgi:hypothetical protein
MEAGGWLKERVGVAFRFLRPRAGAERRALWPLRGQTSPN